MDPGSVVLLKKTVSVLAKDIAPTLRAIAMTVITIMMSFRIFSLGSLFRSQLGFKLGSVAVETHIGQMRCLTPPGRTPFII